MILRLASRFLLVATALVLAAYLGLCGFLFFEQRHILYQPGAARLDGPPHGSGFLPLTIEVPKVGSLQDWWVAPSEPGTPTVVFFHGNAGDVTSFLKLGSALHARGWGVVLASYPGYSGQPGKPTETNLLADARATIATVAPRVGPIIVWGHSLGSGVAARMASEGRAAGLVLEAPYTSMTDVAARSYPYVPVRLLLLDRFDTRSVVDRVRVPVLIFHSADDPIVPFDMGQALADRLAGRATFVRMSGVGHYPHRRDLSGVVLSWANEHNLGR